MKAIWKKSAVIALAGLLALSVAGCGDGNKKAEGGKEADTKDTLKVAAAGFADFLEPTFDYNGWQVVRYGVGETLVKFDKKMNVTPWLAESWKISDDRLTWTFRINDKAVFSNGNKVTGDAAAKSLLRTLEKSPRAKRMLRVVSINGEGQNVLVRTERPVPTLPQLLGDPLFLIVDASVTDRDYEKMGPIGTGPFVVKSFTKGKCILERNEKYWNGRAFYRNLVISSVNDPGSRAMALKKGEIDVAADIGSGDLDMFKDAKKFRISENASVRSVLARLTVKEGRPLSDKRVREALASALDRKSYCKVLLKDTFTSGGPLLPPSVCYGFNELIKSDKNQYNVGRARKLLADAGWKDTNGDGFVDKNGKNLELDCYFCSNRAELPLFAEATRSDARRVGIKINLKNVDYTEIDKIGREGSGDLCITNISTVQGDPEVFMNMYVKTNENNSNSGNGGGFSNAGYDELSDRLAVEFDPAKRRELIIGMEKIALEELPLIVYGYPRTNIVSKAEIANTDIHPCDYYWETKDWKPAAIQ